ncbi:MAG: putative Fe-S protein YdhL (DUF1289 family) [Alteromonadaceae bacterium]|jgi:predicted Fe-S protein YdhL (DUF1289 family)
MVNDNMGKANVDKVDTDNADIAKNDTIASPCVRNCCLNNDDICIGCFRHLDEIMSWQAGTNENKSEILTKCRQRRDQERR